MSSGYDMDLSGGAYGLEMATGPNPAYLTRRDTAKCPGGCAMCTGRCGKY